MCPFQAISFLSLHASFPSYLYLVEKKTKTAAALHILVKEEKLALELLEQIKNGGDFEKLAKKHSICPSGKKGGHLGEFRQGQMVPAFDKVVFSCPVLEPTGPLHTQFGYHIIKVLYRN